MTPTIARGAAFVLAFGSIACLLLMCFRVLPMSTAGLWIGLPSMLALAGIYLWSRWGAHIRWEEDLRVGLWGGLLGTLGYDVVRIPFHLLGYNPFGPIRSYGMFLVDAPHSGWISDLVGLAYHFSNGLSFGVIYSLVMRDRHWGWAVLWGLVLETMAAVTPFGAVYGLRTNLPMLAIAYFAHLYYGAPLGALCCDVRRGLGWAGRLAPVSLISTVALVGFLLVLWGGWTRPPRATVLLGPEQITAGWTRVAPGEMLTLINQDSAPLSWSLGGKEGSLEPGASVQVPADWQGLRQLVVRDRSWRSGMISADQGGFLTE